VFSLVLLIGLGTALAAGREPISISGEVTLAEEPPFLGEVTVAIGGEELECTVQVIPIGGMFERPTGGYDFPEVLHIFTTLDEESEFTTTGAEFTEPTDENPAVHTLHGNMEIISGSGVFDGASGKLQANGQIVWSVGQATFKANGVISR
jgi:hypothetical protein